MVDEAKDSTESERASAEVQLHINIDQINFIFISERKYFGWGSCLRS